MKTIQSIILVFFFFSNLSIAQDHLAFTALRSEGYGAYAHNFGHNIPLAVCGLAVAYSQLVSVDGAPPGEFSNTNGGLKLASGGIGFSNFTAALATHSYELVDVEMKFTLMTLGSDTQNQDWFVVDDTETRFYQNGVFTFYVDGFPIVTGTMPVLKLEIDYNTLGNCGDDVISSVTQYTAVADASAGQTADIQAIAAAFLADVGTKEIRFNFSQMQPAASGTTGAIFESATGKIELGSIYDNMSAIVINQAATNICTTPSTTVTSTGSGNWLHILNGTDRVASILDSENMGAMTAEFYINSGAIRTAGSLEYMDRNFTITPTVQPSGAVTVKLYFTATEWEDFINTSPTDLGAMSDIVISKFSSSDCSAISNASGEVTVPLLDYGYIPTDNSYYLVIEVTSFSTIFVHGPKSASILPVELTSFSGKETEDGIVLNWGTASEANNSGFEIQKSFDGITWSRVAWVDGIGTTTFSQSYVYVDETLQLESLIYYRLKQIDFDDKYEFSPTISIKLFHGDEKVSEFYPNPSSSGEVKLDYTASVDDNLRIVIYDLSGKIVLENSVLASEGVNHLSFDFSILKEGFHVAKIDGKVGSFYKKLIIEK